LSRLESGTLLVWQVTNSFFESSWLKNCFIVYFVGIRGSDHVGIFSWKHLCVIANKELKASHETFRIWEGGVKTPFYTCGTLGTWKRSWQQYCHCIRRWLMWDECEHHMGFSFGLSWREVSLTPFSGTISGLSGHSTDD
jgi:hypothetical protein